MKIVVLAGGTSPERDVSLSSGKMIYQALRERGHKTILLDVYLGYENKALLGNQALYDIEIEMADTAIFEKDMDWAANVAAISSESPDIAAVKALRPDGEKNYFGPNVIALCRAADVVFIALHGEEGENGKIQACFDLMGIKYTGAGYLGSALALDKILAKELFCHHAIPTPPWVALPKGADHGAAMAIPYPRFVKTKSGGSSVGAAIARDEAAFATALQDAYRYEDTALVEPYITGRELSVGVLAGKALPVIEIAPKQGFFDYHNKYQPGASIETCPADIAVEMTRKLQELAEKVYRILRMDSYARVDFIVDGEANIFCLEANTLPGMAPTSLMPKEAAAAGMDFGTFCEAIMDVSLRPPSRNLSPQGILH